jgi:alanine racemase
MLMARTAVALLSRDNLLHNLDIIKSYAPRALVLAMVKANAYGHGLRSTALCLDKHVDGFGVASIDEALALRKVGITSSIILMEGVFEASELKSAMEEDFHVVFHSAYQLQWLKEEKLLKPLKVWLKVNTGMGRLGFSMQEALEAIKTIELCDVIKPIGLMSHLACADDKEHEHNNFQQKNFAQLVSHHEGPKSLHNSAAIFNFPHACYDLIRPGLALYGVSPLKNSLAQDLKLKPVMTLQSSLIAVRYEQKGAFIGYGALFQCPENMPIGIVAMGYGDGYPQKNIHMTPVLINNKRCRIIGRVSMDMAAVDLRECPHAQVGDPVILWGEGLPLEEVAHYFERTPYELLSSVQLRVKFKWH